MKNLKRVLPVLGVILWAVLLLPFFLGAPAAHPATDDFTFAVYTHPTWIQTGSILHVLKDALAYALRTWRDWQGTVTGVIIMTLNPAVFSIDGYGWHAVILLALCLLATGVFLRHFLGKRLGISKGMTLAAFLSLSAVQLLFLPDIVEGVYWFNGAWFYMGAQAAALLTLTLADEVCERRMTGVKTVLCAALCWGLLFALGMDNYITAMMTAAALLMMALERAWAARQTGEIKPAIRTAWMLIPIGMGLLLAVAAPGNQVRMATDGAHQSGMGWLISSIFWTMRDAVKLILRFSLKTPLLALLLLAAPTLCAQLNVRHEKGKKCPPVWAAWLGLHLILRHDHPAYVFIGIRGFRACGQYVSLLCAACDADCLCDESVADEGKEARCAGEQTRESYLLCACRGGVCAVHRERTAPPLSEARQRPA
ncbi:MAG: hypothetical protein V8Q79_00190 [Christensenellales bacterium]